MITLYPKYLKINLGATWASNFEVLGGFGRIRVGVFDIFLGIIWGWIFNVRTFR